MKWTILQHACGNAILLGYQRMGSLERLEGLILQKTFPTVLVFLNQGEHYQPDEHFSAQLPPFWNHVAVESLPILLFNSCC